MRFRFARNYRFQHTAARRRLVRSSGSWRNRAYRFNTQPPEGGWCSASFPYLAAAVVSTHSRPKAAGNQACQFIIGKQFQHTAARRRLDGIGDFEVARFTFQHTAARRRLVSTQYYRLMFDMFQHTAARRRLGKHYLMICLMRKFQHTAARRRLGLKTNDLFFL